MTRNDDAAQPNDDVRLVEQATVPYLISVPPGGAREPGGWPVLCFLHGYEEGPPTSLHAGLRRHGPLAPGSHPVATSEFLVLAPQLPTRGDLWADVAAAVMEIVRHAQTHYGGDPNRTFCTGFSFGGNGVFDLALAEANLWTALWPVDPTRVPERDPGLPVWLSSGAASRPHAGGFVERLRLETLQEALMRDSLGQRIYLDEGHDHVGTAHSAYQDERIYRWLLAHG